MRIALSNASSAWGGVHLVTEILATGLQARGHELRVLCRPGSRLETRMRGIAPLDPVLWGPDLNPRSMWAAWRALRRFRPTLRRHGLRGLLGVGKVDEQGMALLRAAFEARWEAGADTPRHPVAEIELVGVLAEDTSDGAR